MQRTKEKRALETVVIGKQDLRQQARAPPSFPSLRWTAGFTVNWASDRHLSPADEAPGRDCASGDASSLLTLCVSIAAAGCSHLRPSDTTAQREEEQRKG